MINHFNFKQIGTEFLITNDFGMFAFLKPQELYKFLSGKISFVDSCYSVLNDNYFLIDKPKELFIQETSEYLRRLKSYVFSATALHIFAVTNMCNMNCVYCQAKATSSILKGKMTAETGKKAIELAMQSPSKHLTFEFQGGEPLLNFDVVKIMIEHSKKINVDKTIEYTIVTNLILIDDKMLDYLIEQNVSICTSLDGCANVHNNNRRLKSGDDSFTLVKQGIRKIKDANRQIGAIETTTNYSLKYPIDIINTYLDMGMSSIFLRPLTPLGFASEYWKEIGYNPEEYLKFYREAFEYIIRINIEGKNFPEVHSTYFLKKILGGYSDNYMELRSPCGASIGQMSYYYDGSVFTCDEGRMLSETGDLAFRLGNVYENTYDQLMNTSVCKTTCVASVIESLPTCCDCAYNPYCGVCPVVTYFEDKDIFPKTTHDYRCKIYSGMLDLLFEKIKIGDDATMKIFYNWIKE